MAKTNSIKHDWQNGTRYRITRHYDQAAKATCNTHLKDDRGRLIGFRTSIIPCDCVKLDEDADTNYSIRFADPDLAGRIWYAVANATRDGQDYGASQSGRYFAKLEDAEKYLDERVRSSTARYRRRYA